MKRKDTRPLTVNGTLWEYKIGRNTVAIYDSEGKRYFPRFIEIIGKDLDNGNLNPAAILNYINSKILDTKELIPCKYCKRKSLDVRLRYNPFKAEIRGDYNKEFICNECASDIAEEI